MSQSPHSLQLLCIGNALVDILAQVEDNFLIERNIVKGAMELVDAEGADKLNRELDEKHQVAGGSAANTAIGFASLGGQCAYSGVVCDDAAGQVFRRSLNESGVHFQTPPRVPGQDLATGCSTVLVTPDGERSMQTFLGIAVSLNENDLNEASVENADIIYFEGYLWAAPDARKALFQAAEIAHRQGNRIALTLSDIFVVDNHREDFLSLINEGVVDIILANEGEIMSLYQTDNRKDALEILAENCRLASVTLGARGAVSIENGTIIEIASPARTQPVIDTTGAGDLYASGFLYGILNGYNLTVATQLGHICAGHIISHIGARPQTSLQNLAVEADILQG